MRYYQHTTVADLFDMDGDTTSHLGSMNVDNLPVMGL